MKENFWYRDPLAAGHTAADRILEKQKQETEMAEADLHAAEDNSIEDETVEPILESEDDKENPSEEYYGRFEQFRGVKKDSDVYKKNEKVNNNKKKPGKRKPYNDLQVFDPYK